LLEESLPANSYLQKVYIAYVSGTVHISVSDGIDLDFSQDMAGEDLNIIVDQKYSVPKILTITITGGIVNIRTELYPNYC
jgi:hypothetical protein